MKRNLLIIYLALCPLALFAWTWTDTPTATTTHSMQMRVGANFNKKWRNGLGLHIKEDLRFDLFGITNGVNGGANFNKSYTTLALSYKHPLLRELKLDAGYTLKILGTKDWANVNKWMRHRLFFSLTGSYRYEQWSFSLRERVMTEIRMGDIDQHTATGYYEHNRADWFLRSKLEVAYHAMSKPLKPYIWCELVNTLNANPLRQKYANNDPTQPGHQYIRRVRSAIGVVWRLSKHNSLDFMYRFNYGYERDVTLKAKSQALYLTEETDFMHAIGICYHFNW